MSRSEARSGRRLYLVFGGLLLLNLVLMTYNVRRLSPEDGTEQTVLRVWTVSLLAPIQNWVGTALDFVGSFWSGYLDLRGAREENEHLRVENAQLRQENEVKTAAAAEATRLKQLLELQDQTKYPFVVAGVVARDATTWFRRVTIDKGSLRGIKLNMPVVTPGGLVGRIVAVGPNAAEVMLITDEHAGAGARLVNSRAAGEIEGRGDGFMRLRSISSILEVKEDDREAIVTSGLDRIFPQGILVGYVERVTPGAGAMPHDILVRPAAPLDRLEEVMVLLVEPRDLWTPEAIK